MNMLGAIVLFLLAVWFLDSVWPAPGKHGRAQ